MNLWSPGEGIVREFGKIMYTLTIKNGLKWIINKDLLYSTWNSIQYYEAAWMGDGFDKNGHMYTYG